MDKNNNKIQQALNEAEKYIRANKASQIPELLSKVKSELDSNDKYTVSRYYRLLAFGFAHSQKYLEAEKVCLQQLENDNHPLDYNFLLAFLSLSLRQYNEAIEYAERFLNLYQIKNKDVWNLTTHSHFLCQMYNYLGSAQLELKNYEKAETAFTKAKEADPKNHLPYLNLINVAQKKSEFKRAELILAEGFKNCHQVQELRMVENSIRNKATVSACMIVKNEEELLPGCLDSIRDWVDEIIIVDTGSNDNTVKIAESYGAKIFHQQWEGDFSRHRNFSIDQAQSDWIFIIDADERMHTEDIPMLKSLLNDKNNNLLSINVFNVYGANEEVTTFLPSVRFFRTEKKLRYEGIVHNRLNYKADEEIVRANIKLKHLGYGLDPEKMKAKFLRTKELLEQQLKDEPNNAFALFNYAQILKAEGDTYPIKNIPKIIESAQKAVDLTDPENPEERFIHLMTLDQIAWAHFYANRYDEAIKYAEQALKLKANYLDPLMLLGCVESKRKNWKKAESHFHTYLKTQAAYEPTKEADSLILAHIDSRANVYYNLGLMAEMNHDSERALEYYLKVSALNKGLLEVNDTIARIYLSKNELTLAKKYFQHQLKHSYKTKAAYLGLAEISKQENDRGKAEEYLNQVVTLLPEDPFVNYKYGYFLLEENRPEAAVVYLEKSFAVDKENPKILKILADTYFMLRQYNEALDKFNILLNLEKPNAGILNDIGNCYFNLQKYDQAAQSYRKSLAQVEPLDFTQKNLAIAELRLSNYSEALKALQNYLLKNNADIEALILCGDIFKKTENYPAALEKYEIVLSSDRTNIHALYQLSECYLLMGHKDSAILGYKSLLAFNPDYKPALARLEEISAVETSKS